MSGDGAPAAVVPWPGHYDVADVPPATFTPEALPDKWSGAVFNDGDESVQLPLYWATGKAVKSVNTFGDEQAPSYWYESTGRRKQMFWSDGTPASNYWPDGTQIPLYATYGSKITNDVDDPLWTPPEPEDPEDPEDPGDPGGPEPGAGLVTVAELQAFMPDDALDADLCALAVEAATAVVAAYCRDRHLDASGRPRPGVKTVALTVAARIAANPSGISRQDTAGSFSTRRSGGFTRFTLAELTVLKRYRRKAIGP